MRKRSIYIVGAGGMVGASAASALALQEVAQDIALIDVNQSLVEGQAMDLADATAFAHDVRIRVGEYHQIGPQDIVIITAGLPQASKDQSRLALLDANSQILLSIMDRVRPQHPAFIVIVSNPVDLLTRIAWEHSGLPRERVFGTGTALDSARLRMVLAQALNVVPNQIHAYVLGEHGDSSFAALSAGVIGGVPLQQFPGFTNHLVKDISAQIRNQAAKIIAAKKSTYFGIGQVVAQVVAALNHKANTVLPLSAIVDGEYGLDSIAIGLPALINNEGAHVIGNYPLDKAELQQLNLSAEILKKALAAYHNRHNNAQVSSVAE